MNWILRRLREPSTWRGLVWLATVAGLSMRPDQAEAIVVAGMALVGLLGVFLPEESKAVSIELPPIELMRQSQGHNDASQNLGEAPIYPLGRTSADVAPQNPIVRRAGAGIERSDPAIDELHQSV